MTKSLAISGKGDQTHYIQHSILKQNPTTIDQGTTIRIEKNQNKNALLQNKLNDIKAKIEERFAHSNLNNGYSFRRQSTQAFISKRGLKPRIKQINYLNPTT